MKQRRWREKGRNDDIDDEMRRSILFSNLGVSLCSCSGLGRARSVGVRLLGTTFNSIFVIPGTPRNSATEQSNELLIRFTTSLSFFFFFFPLFSSRPTVPVRMCGHSVRFGKKIEAESFLPGCYLVAVISCWAQTRLRVRTVSFSVVAIDLKKRRYKLCW